MDPKRILSVVLIVLGLLVTSIGGASAQSTTTPDYTATVTLTAPLTASSELVNTKRTETVTYQPSTVVTSEWIGNQSKPTVTGTVPDPASIKSVHIVIEETYSTGGPAIYTVDIAGKEAKSFVPGTKPTKLPKLPALPKAQKDLTYAMSLDSSTSGLTYNDVVEGWDTTTTINYVDGTKVEYSVVRGKGLETDSKNGDAKDEVITSVTIKKVTTYKSLAEITEETTLSGALAKAYKYDAKAAATSTGSTLPTTGGLPSGLKYSKAGNTSNAPAASVATISAAPREPSLSCKLFGWLVASFCN